MTTTPLSRNEIEERARQRFREVYGHEPDPASIQDHGSPTLRAHLDQEMRDRLENCRREVQSRHAHRQAREAEQAALSTARLKAASAGREAELRRRFDARFPGGSDADYQTLRPSLLAELSAAAEQSEQVAHAEARRRVRI
jgi:hypothetical protein